MRTRQGAAILLDFDYQGKACVELIRGYWCWLGDLDQMLVSRMTHHLIWDWPTFLVLTQDAHFKTLSVVEGYQYMLA